MKKLILLSILLSFGILSYGQGWTQENFPADELKNTEAYIAYNYEDEQGNQFVYWSNDIKSRVYCAHGIFNFGTDKCVDVIVGYYNDKGEMIKRDRETIKSTNGKYNMGSFCIIRKNKVREYLTTQKGYVRLLIPQYRSTSYWEMKVPCVTNDITTKTKE